MKIIECPRDAIQGLHEIVPTEDKINYLNILLEVGFDTIDFGSFVSPKAIPQMADTKEVLSGLDYKKSKSKLLAIIANERGAHEAAEYEQISYLGFPLSLSETFQHRNTNKSIQEALEQLLVIQDICKEHEKTLVTYLSMAFGNPYGDEYSIELIQETIYKLDKLDIKVISLADTIGKASSNDIREAFESASAHFSHIEFGVHLHSDKESSIEKIEAAYLAGCKRFDGAVNGFGGCPMADDKLVGNIATETLIEYFTSHNIDLQFNANAFQKALNTAPGIFLGR